MLIYPRNKALEPVTKRNQAFLVFCHVHIHATRGHCLTLIVLKKRQLHLLIISLPPETLKTNAFHQRSGLTQQNAQLYYTWLSEPYKGLIISCTRITICFSLHHVLYCIFSSNTQQTTLQLSCCFREENRPVCAVHHVYRVAQSPFFTRVRGQEQKPIPAIGYWRHFVLECFNSGTGHEQGTCNHITAFLLSTHWYSCCMRVQFLHLFAC